MLDRCRVASLPGKQFQLWRRTALIRVTSSGY